MSDQLPFLERLWWNAHYRTGVATVQGNRMHFDAPPPGLEHAIAIDFVPSLPLKQIQTKASQMQDMNEAEVRAAESYLRAIAQRSRGDPP